jgi:hypothetical protein
MVQPLNTIAKAIIPNKAGLVILLESRPGFTRLRALKIEVVSICHPLKLK